MTNKKKLFSLSLLSNEWLNPVLSHNRNNLLEMQVHCYHAAAQYRLLLWHRQKCWGEWRWSLRGCCGTYCHSEEHGLYFLWERTFMQTFMAALKWRQHKSLCLLVLHIYLFFSHYPSYLPLSLRYCFNNWPYLPTCSSAPIIWSYGSSL